MMQEIREYMAEKRAEGRSVSTLYEYSLYLTAFVGHCGDKPLAEITNADIVGWISAEQERQEYASASILARWRAIKIFLRWCVASGLLDKTPLRMKSPKIKRELSRVANYDHVQTVLQFPADDWTDYRNVALVHLMFDTGMRIGEAVGLRMAHVDFNKRLISIPPGKNGEGRVVPFTVKWADTAERYLFLRPASAWDTWLFNGCLHGNPRNRLSVGGARDTLYRFYSRVGVDPINPHSLRHLFATRALNAGMRVETLSRILGHADVHITLRVYARLNTVSIQREYDHIWQG